MTATQHATAIVLAPRLLDAIARHAEQTYPEECCGILLGQVVDGERVITRLAPIENGWDGDERGHRFLIGPQDVLKAERQARRDGLDVLGFYHSHPDSPARPSAFDREHAWPWYSYLIAAVERRRCGEVRAWQLRDDRAGYEEVAVSARETD
jgi:proteasome lid subunit RPN8/RPN11